MATIDDIPTDLALEIGDDLEPTRFVAALRAFFGLTEELAQFSTADNTPHWRVIVSKGSNIVALDAAPSMSANVVSNALQKISERIRAIVAGDISAASLSERAIDCAKRLSELTNDGSRRIPMCIWVNRQPIEYGPQIAEWVREDKASAYDDFGTVEGMLRVIADQSGTLKIKIFDPIWRRPIPCKAGEDKIEDVIMAFRKRVEVSGLIHYNHRGGPTSIRMDTLKILADDNTLPKISEVAGILS